MAKLVERKVLSEDAEKKVKGTESFAEIHRRFQHQNE